MDVETSAIIQYKIPKRDWPILRDMYKIYWPRHIISYNTFRTYIEWTERNPKFNVIVYTSDENWKIHGTYVIADCSGPCCFLLYNTLNAEKYEDLVFKALQQIHIDQSYAISCSIEQMNHITNKFLINRQLKRKITCCDTLLYYLPRKESLQFRMQAFEDFHFKPISTDDVEFINNNWRHRYPGSSSYVEKLVKYYITLGAYKEKTQQICGWALLEPTGTIGMIQVVDSCKRQDLKEELIMRMAILLAKAGMDASATVWATNRKLRKVFHKLGFKIIGRLSWRNLQLEQDKEIFIESEGPNCV